MKKYSVTIPIAGSYTVDVEADDEEGAIDAAMERQGDDDLELEWEALHEICQGNVCYAPVWEASAEES